MPVLSHAEPAAHGACPPAAEAAAPPAERGSGQQAPRAAWEGRGAMSSWLRAASSVCRRPCGTMLWLRLSLFRELEYIITRTKEQGIVYELPAFPANKGYFHKKTQFHFSSNLITGLKKARCLPDPRRTVGFFIQAPEWALLPPFPGLTENAFRVKH